MINGTQHSSVVAMNDAGLVVGHARRYSVNMAATDTNWGLIMAASTLATLPMALAFGLVQRYLVTGMGAGGVKG